MSIADKARRVPGVAAAEGEVGRLEKKFADAGGTLLAGTDPTGYGGVIPGFSGKREVELLVEAGFTFPDGAPGPLCNGSAYAMWSILRSLYAGREIPTNVVVPSPSANMNWCPL